MSMNESTRLRQLEDRIKSSYKIDRSTGCWVGQTEVLNNGYCRFTIRFDRYFGSERQMLHRLMYERYYGNIPVGYELDHLCKSKRCCNPFHLKPVSRLQNVLNSNVTKLSEDDIKTIKTLVANGWSQKMVASKFKINQCHVSRLINGKRRVG